MCEALRQAGHRALFAGGCVRDRLLGIVPKDYDIATSARPEAVMALFPRCIPVGVAFGVIIVPRSGAAFEVTTFRQDGPYHDGRHPESVAFLTEHEDAARRDFTINALFFDPETETVIDYVGGQEDLRAGRLRAVGDAKRRFEEDYLRMLRAVRFAARFGYTIHADTLLAIQTHAHKITRTSPERICEELTKILMEGHAKAGFELLDAAGLLQYVLPEVHAMKGIEQPPEYHPEGDVFTHTLLLLEQLHEPSPTLCWGTLLHDVGKPPTQTFEDRIRFNHHARVGAEMADQIARRLHMSNEWRNQIVWLVDQHMRVADIPEMREARRKRFVRESGFPELLTLCRMDCVASHADTRIVEWIQDYIAALPPEAVRPPRLITGEDLIAWGYAPGPHFREMLDAVEDAQLEGQLCSKEEAEALVRERWAH